MLKLLTVEARRKVGSKAENRFFRKTLALPALPVPKVTLVIARREYQVETVYMTDGQAAVVAWLTPDYEAYKKAALVDRCRLMGLDGFAEFEPEAAGRGRLVSPADPAEGT